MFFSGLALARRLHPCLQSSASVGEGFCSWRRLAKRFRRYTWSAIAPRNSEVLIRDVRKPLPFPFGAARAIYASHLLERLYLREGRQLIRESSRVQKAIVKRRDGTREERKVIG